MSWRSALRRLVAGVGADPLQGLDLVEDEQQPGVAGVAQHGEQALQEAEGPEVVEVAPDPGGPLGGGGRRAAAAEPGEQPVGGRRRRRPACGRR